MWPNVGRETRGDHPSRFFPRRAGTRGSALIRTRSCKQSKRLNDASGKRRSSSTRISGRLRSSSPPVPQPIVYTGMTLPSRVVGVDRSAQVHEFRKLAAPAGQVERLEWMYPPTAQNAAAGEALEGTTGVQRYQDPRLSFAQLHSVAPASLSGAGGAYGGIRINVREEAMQDTEAVPGHSDGRKVREQSAKDPFLRDDAHFHDAVPPSSRTAATRIGHNDSHRIMLEQIQRGRAEDSARKEAKRLRRLAMPSGACTGRSSHSAPLPQQCNVIGRTRAGSEVAWARNESDGYRRLAESDTPRRARVREWRRGRERRDREGAASGIAGARVRDHFQ